MNQIATLSTLQTEITALTERLEPSNDDGVAKALSSLLAAGLVLPATMKAEQANNVYSFALAKLSKSALVSVTMKIIRGEFPNMNLHFIPTPPELANAVRAEQQKIVEDLTRARLKSEAFDRSQPSKVSADERERMLEKLALWRAGQPIKTKGGWEPAAVTKAKRDFAGVQVLAENITMEQFRIMAKEKKFPQGARFSAILSTVFAPSAEVTIQ